MLHASYLSSLWLQSWPQAVTAGCPNALEGQELETRHLLSPLSPQLVFWWGCHCTSAGREQTQRGLLSERHLPFQFRGSNRKQVSLPHKAASAQPPFQFTRGVAAREGASPESDHTLTYPTLCEVPCSLRLLQSQLSRAL